MTAPSGWLDIHAHFFLPSTDEEAEKLSEAFRSVDFMVKGPVKWEPETILKYNDKAGVTMQMLSYIPPDHKKLRAANDFGNEMVRKYPNRFGLLAALPTDDPDACLGEIKRVTTEFEPQADGFALTTAYNDVSLADKRLDRVWEDLDRRRAVIHIHPNAYLKGSGGRPSPVIEVAFDTCRTVVDMMYNGVFRRFPNIRFVLGHCGGALPALSGRLSLLGTEDWVPNPNKITRKEIEEQLGRMYIDTAATAKTGLAPAVKMVGIERCIYGADCGVPCSTEQTMEENRLDIVTLEKEMGTPAGQIAKNGWALFPNACVRAERG